jgi:single-stranded DNA-binding protein
MQYPGIAAFVRGYVQKVEARGALTVLSVKVPGRKDQRTGEVGPATFLDVKVFAKQAGEVQPARERDTIEVEAWAKTEEWTGKDGEKRNKLAWYLSRVVEIVPDTRANRHDDIQL